MDASWVVEDMVSVVKRTAWCLRWEARKMYQEERKLTLGAIMGRDDSRETPIVPFQVGQMLHKACRIADAQEQVCLVLEWQILLRTWWK